MAQKKSSAGRQAKRKRYRDSNQRQKNAITKLVKHWFPIIRYISNKIDPSEIKTDRRNRVRAELRNFFVSKKFMTKSDISKFIDMMV